MKKKLIALATAVTLGFSGALFAQPGTGKVLEAGGGGELVSVSATVQAVDQANRIVTLKGPEGEVFDLKVGPEVKNLPQVKVGDVVVAKYFEAVAIEVRKGGLGIRSAESQTAVSRAEPGQRPAGAIATTTTVVANVLKVDAAKHIVTRPGTERQECQGQSEGSRGAAAGEGGRAGRDGDHRGIRHRRRGAEEVAGFSGCHPLAVAVAPFRRGQIACGGVSVRRDREVDETLS